MKKPVKFVWFDVGNVIVRASHAITHAILRDLGVAPDKARLFFQCKPYLDFSRGKISPEQFARALRRLLKCHLADDVLQLAHDAHIYTVDYNVKEIIKALNRQPIRLDFVTNTNEWQTRHIENPRSPAEMLFPVESVPLKNYGLVIRSYDIGMLKTDPGFWNQALLMAHLWARDAPLILLIDDNPDNIAAAKAAGLQTYLYDTTFGKGAKKLHAMLKRRGLL